MTEAGEKTSAPDLNDAELEDPWLFYAMPAREAAELRVMLAQLDGRVDEPW